MWVILENPNPVRGKKYPQIINLDTGDRIYIDIVTNQHEVDTDLHVWGHWASARATKLFTGSESECVNLLKRFAKRLNVQALPTEDTDNAKKGIC